MKYQLLLDSSAVGRTPAMAVGLFEQAHLCEKYRKKRGAVE